MKKAVSLIALAGLLIAIGASAALAHDDWNQWLGGGPWNRFGPGTTTQGWEFTQSPTALVASPFYNPNGYASVSSDGVWTSGTGYVFSTGMWIKATIPNYPTLNPYKEIALQFTTNGGLSLDPLVSGDPAITMDSVTLVNTINEGGGFETYQYLIHIHPNPRIETISLAFNANSTVRELWIDTICVPEPSALLALLTGIGGLVGVLVRRRRRA